MSRITIFKKVKKYIVPALLVLGIFLFFRSKNNMSVIVKRVEVKDREIRKTISASGIVRSNNKVDLSFLPSGVLSGLNVSEGSVVKKGDLIAYINPSSQVQMSQSYKDARDMRIIQKELFEEEKSDNVKILGGEDSYNIKLREYEEALSQAEASYQSQLSILSNYYIYAPFDGVVIDVLKKKGETVTTGIPVVSLADLNEMYFEVLLDQEDYGLIKVDQEAEIELDAYEGKVFKGKLQDLPSYADENLGSFVIKIDFETNGEAIKIGMIGDAFMITDKSDNQVRSLNFNDISYDSDDKPFVWVLENGKVKRLYVELGLEGDLYTEIKTDLAGKTVVAPINESSKIEEGFVAKVIN